MLQARVEKVPVVESVGAAEAVQALVHASELSILIGVSSVQMA